jgi:outer membrane protein OmpA-like peptidoglycan-associated protein
MISLKRLQAFLVCLFILSRLSAQNIPGYCTSNYAGISGFNLQPASIADSRYKFDMTLFGGGFIMYNNYLELTHGFYKEIIRPSGQDFADAYIRESETSTHKNIDGQAYVQMPSFMVSLGKTSALAFNWRVRHITNIERMNVELARLAYNALDVPSLYNIKLENDQFNINTMTWQEFGLGYAQVLKAHGSSFIKIGGQAKLVSGISAGYFYARNLNYSWKNSDTLNLFTSEFGYGLSDNLDFKGNLDQTSVQFKSITKPSPAFDLGAVYEWRPNYGDYMYDLDGEYGLVRKDKSKYKARIGISLLDVGRIKFKKSTKSGDFKADIRDWNVHDLKFQSVDDFNHMLDSIFVLQKTGGYFTMALPTTFSVQADYNFGHSFYLNFTSYLSPRFIKDENKVHALNYYSLTPRWDTKWIGVFLPMTFNAYGKFTAGAAFHLGPVVFGSNSMLNLFAGSISGMDFHFAVKIPIGYGKPKDRDNDKVSNKRDRCPDEPGTWETRGCPDKDGDLIADKNDECPDVAGLGEFHGCPDTDGDKIPDKDDFCPTSPGLAKFQGCPDADGDNIPDYKDNCPMDAGPEKTKGCPDKDGDGVVDIADRCPDVPGLEAGQGCPDTDGDKVYDPDDKCVNKAGPIDNDGCPYADRDNDGVADKNDACPDVPGSNHHAGCPDTDGDGVYDHEDQCVNTPGDKDNFGCPKLDEEEKNILTTAFDNLEFEGGSTNIAASSFPTMEKLASMMLKKPNVKLKIAGHTDDVGEAEANLDLSKRRAEAVKDFLVKKGVAPERFIVEYYGEYRPIADNSTPEGRQKNRRVELSFIFD